MFGSDIIDVLIGLVTVFLLLSLTATALREAIESVLKARAAFLERGIRELLDDPGGSRMVKRFYEHPLIYSLYRGGFKPITGTRIIGRKLPAYIPSKSFSAAVLDIALRGQRAGPYAASHSDPILTVEQLRRAVERLPNTNLRHSITTAIDNSGGDLARVRTNLEAWFDASMDRVSGWYKRQTQFYLFVIGIVLAGMMNVNTITIANHLWKDKAAREALARRAELLKADPMVQRMLRDSVLNDAQAKRVSAELAALDLPIGWDRQVWPAAGVNPIPPYLHIFFGLLITGLAVTLGAPFWFDALNKFMVIRSTVKPREKSQEESSEDRQTDKKGQVVVNMPGSAPPAPLPPAPPSAPPTPPPDFTPREWAFGDPNEGLL
jgi:hypothetical protein